MQKKGAHVQIDAVRHRYSGRGPVVLDGIDLAVEPGQMVAIVGRSGCGKSTLLHMIAGLLMPTEGGVWIDGLRVRGPSPKWIMMFQQPSLYPWMTVRQNAALGPRFQGRSRQARRRVEDLLAMVDLTAHMDSNVQDLSGGQQQRVALARSLANEPEVLLLDEPFSALDPFTRAALQRDVRAIARDAGITLVLVTHSIDEAVIMADRAIVMGANPGSVRADVAIRRDGADESDTGRDMGREMERLSALFERAVGERLEDTEPDAAAPAPVRMRRTSAA